MRGKTGLPVWDAFAGLSPTLFAADFSKTGSGRNEESREPFP
jgi:hypothetical protein